MYLAAAWPNEGSICLVTIPPCAKNVKKLDIKMDQLNGICKVGRGSENAEMGFLPLLFDPTPGIVDQKLSHVETIL